eukprot:c24894_g6_i2 orf=413-1219(+)
MGNVSGKGGEGRCDAGMTMMMHSVSSGMVVDVAAAPSGSPMAFTPPDASPCVIIPQIPEVPLCHVNDPWKFHTQNGDGKAPPASAVATMLQWNHGGTNVCVEGSWDNWSTRSPLYRASKDFYLLKLLPPGIYHYKFLVNGEYKHSPDLPFTHDEKGNGINILDVKGCVPENLEGVAEFEAPGSPEASYDSAFPGSEDFSKDPPLLPSQLHLNTQLDVFHRLLNSTSNSNGGSAETLIRPQHVVLNHLFVETRKAASSTPVVTLGFTQR